MNSYRPLIFVSALLISSLPGQDKKTPSANPGDDPYAQMEVLTRAMELIRQNYVDEKKVSYERLVASALRGMLEDLDPHSQYIAPELHDQMQQPGEGSVEGAGFTLAPRSGGLQVVTVREDGPAARAGLMPADVVLKIGDAHAAQLDYLEAARLLRGNPGEPLHLTIWRNTSQETREFEIIRETQRQETVRDAMLLDASLTGGAKIGYVRLLQFSAPTATELADALDRLEEGGMTALVLDLRNNPGGLLNGTVEVCGEFLPPNTVVVTTEGRDPAKNPPPLKTPPRQRRARTYPMAVLVNHASASGAELMAGALQDLGRAVIVGTTTFGKGSVQSIIPNGNRTAIRLTTARYFTPKHRTIHEKGVVPDIMAPLTRDEEARLMDYLRKAPEANADPVRLAKLSDPQLERAVTALKGVLIYRASQKKPPSPPPSREKR
jgi:carboxyl-terminal processing protease